MDVPDALQPGAFDEAVKDVQLIEHIACPCHTNFKTPSDLIDPAVRGTTGDAARYTQVARQVAITSRDRVSVSVEDANYMH